MLYINHVICIMLHMCICVCVCVYVGVYMYMRGILKGWNDHRSNSIHEGLRGKKRIYIYIYIYIYSMAAKALAILLVLSSRKYMIATTRYLLLLSSIISYRYYPFFVSVYYTAFNVVISIAITHTEGSRMWVIYIYII